MLREKRLEKRKNSLRKSSVPKFGTRKAVRMGLHNLLEKDIKEGKELMEICENLSEEDRLLAQIYILALTDRSKYHGSVKK